MPIKPRFIAYRGNSIAAPPNSALAIKQALDYEVEGIYVDLMYTSDEEIICWFEPLNPSVGRSIIDTSQPLDKIKKIDLGDIYGSSFKGQRILTISELFELVNGKADLYFGLVSGSRHFPNIEERVIDYIIKEDILSTCTVLSLDHMALKWIKKINSSISILAMNFCRLVKPIDFALDLMADGIVSYHYLLTPYIVEAAQRELLDVYSFAPVQKKDIDEMINIKVDGIMSPDVGLLKDYMEKTFKADL